MVSGAAMADKIAILATRGVKMCSLHSGYRAYLACHAIALLGIFLSSGFHLLAQAHQDNATRPNIVFILCDDLGYADVQCYGGKIPTPYMDRLASQGMRFLDAHTSSAVCSPTRYGLLTGRYNWRSPLKRGVLGGLSPRLIEDGRLTLAMVLKNQGYHTACIGKWHLGMDWVKKPGATVAALSIESRDQVFNVDYSQPIARGPNSVGFDEYFGISASLDMVPYTFIHNDRVTVLPTEDRDFPMMLGRMGGRTRRGPAAPNFEASDVLPTLGQRACQYIAHRAEAARSGEPFFLYLALASPHTPILPSPEWQGKSAMNPYADFVMQTDHVIGEVLKALDDHRLTDNTLVILTSDNGCSPQAQFEELARFGHYPSGPLRGHKADLFEGGHRVPFIVRWPGVVTPGTTTDHLVCLTDVMATVAELLGVPLPADAAEDSISFLGTLRGQPTGKRDHLVSHSVNGSFAIRQGPWKLLLCPDSGGWSTPRPGSPEAKSLPKMQLYNLADDLGERHNLYEQHPEIAKRLESLLVRLVEEGRSTPGPKQPNTTPVHIYRNE
jgi:arylsulfatase A-like enzyme